MPACEEDDDTPSVYESDERLPTNELPTPLLEQAEAELTEPEKRRLRELERMAEGISDAEDTKLAGALETVRRLLDGGFNPVVWCYYVQTVEYVADKLIQALLARVPDMRVLCLTGRVGEEKHRQRVAEFMEHAGPRELVTTDCLSAKWSDKESSLFRGRIFP